MVVDLHTSGSADLLALLGPYVALAGVLGYLYLAAMILVLGMEIDVVRRERLWPRALLTPFTDNVQLTEADETSYTEQAQSQRAKGFQEITVTFDHPPPPPS